MIRSFKCVAYRFLHCNSGFISKINAITGNNKDIITETNKQTDSNILPTPTLSVSMVRMFESLCLFVCLEHNSKTNDPKVLKLGIVNDLGISTSDVVLGFQCHRLGIMLWCNNTAWFRTL